MVIVWRRFCATQNQYIIDIGCQYLLLPPRAHTTQHSTAKERLGTITIYHHLSPKWTGCGSTSHREESEMASR